MQQLPGTDKMKAYSYVVLCLLHILYAEGQPMVEDPVRVPGKVLRGSAAGTCPSDQNLMDAKNELRQNISAILTDIRSSNTSCGGTPGWRRVGYLDMTDPSQSCPSGLALKAYSGLRLCGRATNSAGCWSTFYNTGSSQYSRVCGRVRGYQLGNTGAFHGTQRIGLDSHYVAGVSLTHGQVGSRTHVWTMAAGVTEVNNNYRSELCPCAGGTTPPPSFVGSNYFCESGLHTAWDNQYLDTFFPDTPLWDGLNCVSSCCQFNNPPYFTKTLPAPTNDDIELRICKTRPQAYDSPIDQLELYVQ